VRYPLYGIGQRCFSYRGTSLDGIGLGILDALTALILADIMRGTGRYNVARGIAGTVQGVGGSLSNVVAGLIVVTAVSALNLMLAPMPETDTALLERSSEFRIAS
jgi:hypothetical protein